MRRCVLGVVASIAVLFPTLGRAQAYHLPTPAPQVTAATASWQINGEPLFYAGSFYYPAGPTVYFDGSVMVRVGTYQSVPLYADSTLEPYSIVYVPVGGTVMRPYERLRSGDLAGTVGSHTPSFPIQRDTELALASGAVSLITPALPNPAEPEVRAEADRLNVPSGALTRLPPPSAALPPPAPTIIQSLPAPQGNRGVWVEFDGARWTSAGDAVPYSADRFIPVGEYHGFPVYREKDGPSDQIYIPAVRDGALTPYKR
jgi:hypothetical protein